MKAIVCDSVGAPDVLRLQEISNPAVPDDGVLVRVHASSINPVDMYPLSRMSYTQRWLAGRRKPGPVVLGTDFAGTVEAVGRSVTQFQPGDEVFGGKNGAFAEYVSVSETGAVVRKASNVAFEHAAAVPVAAITALQALRDHGRVQPGQRVLINGASGGVGTFAVQIAKVLGAQVTGVCSPGNVDRVRSIGADSVIDYTKEDFTRSGERYDLMLDVAGSRSWSECKRVLDPKGTFVLVGVASVQHESAWRALGHFANVRLASLGGSRRVVMFIAKLKQADLALLGELLSAGKVTPVMDRAYVLNDVPAALRYFDQGHAKGKIAITVP